MVNARLACGPDSESNKAVRTNVASILLRSIFKIVGLADAKQATGVDNCIKISGCCCQRGGMQMFCITNVNSPLVGNLKFVLLSLFSVTL